DGCGRRSESGGEAASAAGELYAQDHGGFGETFRCAWIETGREFSDDGDDRVAIRKRGSCRGFGAGAEGISGDGERGGVSVAVLCGLFAGDAEPTESTGRDHFSRRKGHAAVPGSGAGGQGQDSAGGHVQGAAGPGGGPGHEG